jgi:hypothetical protein
LPKPLKRLKAIVHKGLAETATLWLDIQWAYQWVHRAAHLLANDTQCEEPQVKRRLQGLLGAMKCHRHKAGTLAPAVEHFLKVTRSYWPGLFLCYRLTDVPRTNNALEQFFGSHRYHERRVTGRKVASPTLVLRGAVRLGACAATRLRPFAGEELVPHNLQAWQALRQELESRRQQRVCRRRFRRDPEAYLATLEKDLLQLILPP